MQVVGYYNSFVSQDSIFRIDLDVLTQINYAFLLPRKDGTVYFKDEDNARKVVEFCHKKRKQVFVSVGGWCDGDIILSTVFEKISNNPKVQKRFIKNILKVCEEYSFDGVDIDWEYPLSKNKKQFNYLIVELKKELEKSNKQLSIAIYHSIKGEKKFDYISAIGNKVLSNINYLNIMTYDCHDEDNHSSFRLSVKCINYWRYAIKVHKNKLLIGIPFYTRPSWIPYNELIKVDSSLKEKNFYNGESYNGAYLIKSKIEYARNNCGGVFIWAINYDDEGENSLLKVIQNSL